MGWGIFKKIKQGISKIADFGKKALKTIVDKAPQILETGKKIMDVGGKFVNSDIGNSVLNKLNVNRDKLMNGINTANNIINKGENAVNFAGRTWAPQYN